MSKALSEIPAIREEFWKNVRVLGENESRNQSLEKAGRVADFLEFGELMCRDALHRNESCGGHFREEYQTEEGEALVEEIEHLEEGHLGRRVLDEVLLEEALRLRPRLPPHAQREPHL